MKRPQILCKKISLTYGDAEHLSTTIDLSSVTALKTHLARLRIVLKKQEQLVVLFH
jgi:hypothetical protein